MVVAAMHRRSFRFTKCSIFFAGKDRSATMGILAFDAAKTMSSLVSLYHSLADGEILRLRNETVRSKGVVYLNSDNERFLLNLASMERFDDLNNAALTVARLGKKCSDYGLINFDMLYSDMKLGEIGMVRLDFSSREICKLIEGMEKLIRSTSKLYSAMESLVQMELSEKKLERWKNGLDPKQCLSANLEYFKNKISTHRMKVKRCKATSLWNQTLDNVVGMMAGLVCIIYSRICTIFRPFFSDQPCCAPSKPPQLDSTGCFSRLKGDCPVEKSDGHEETAVKRRKSASKHVPIPKIVKKKLVRFNKESQDVIIPRDIGTNIQSTLKIPSSEIVKNNRIYKLAPPSTVGGSGLSLNYANIIIFAERCLHAPATVSDEVRGELYDMLPARIKAILRTKLRRRAAEEEEECDGKYGGELAEGWQDAVEEMMEWLGPLAHATLRWLSERGVEKQKFDGRPRMLVVQTLYYSDLEKTEVAIAEVLVGLSHIFRYNNNRRSYN